jgi:5'-phosphate synthase pdxT subunit
MRAHEDTRAPLGVEPRRLRGGGAISRIGVLALQGDVREHLTAFAACGTEVTQVRLPHDLVDLDGLVLPGGESTAMSHLLAVSGLEGPLRAALADGLPCFATCAGTILLSRRIEDGRPDQIALGHLDIEVRRNGYGRQAASFESDLAVAGLGAEGFRAVFIRAPRITAVGRGAEVLASLDGHPVAVRQGSTLAFVFHP